MYQRKTVAYRGGRNQYIGGRFQCRWCRLQIFRTLQAWFSTVGVAENAFLATWALVGMGGSVADVAPVAGNPMMKAIRRTPLKRSSCASGRSDGPVCPIQEVLGNGYQRV